MSPNRKTLLIVAHTPSPNTTAMAEAILDGAQNNVIEAVEAQLKSPFDCNSEMILQSDAVSLNVTMPNHSHF